MVRVLVTGGASGIGAAAVVRFKRDGASVASLDLRHGAHATGADVLVDADVTSEEDAKRGVDEAAAALGGLDVAVLCAGVAGRGTVTDVSLAEWDRIFAVNVRGTFLTAKYAIEHLRRAGGGAIVLVASNLGLVAAPNAAAYCASKGAVVNLARAMALDHAAEGIRVNCICPGPTETPMVEAYFAAAADPATERQQFESAQAHGRLMQAEEIADGIAYLASSSAGSTIGAVLSVDGGYTIH